MRVLTICGLAALLSGCSFFDKLNFGAGRRLDPDKIYLGSTRLALSAHADRSKYGCTNGAMLCVQSGASFECSCP